MAHVRRIQELRRSNAATAVPSGKHPSRARSRRETAREIRAQAQAQDQR